MLLLPSPYMLLSIRILIELMILVVLDVSHHMSFKMILNEQWYIANKIYKRCRLFANMLCTL